MSIMRKNKAEHCIYPGSFSGCAAVSVQLVYLLSELNSHSLISSQTPRLPLPLIILIVTFLWTFSILTFSFCDLGQVSGDPSRADFHISRVNIPAYTSSWIQVLLFSDLQPNIWFFADHFCVLIEGVSSWNNLSWRITTDLDLVMYLRSWNLFFSTCGALLNAKITNEVQSWEC